MEWYLPLIWAAVIGTAVAMYVVQLIEPLDDVLSWLDELQVGGASLARIVGVGEVPDDRVAGEARPADEVIRNWPDTSDRPLRATKFDSKDRCRWRCTVTSVCR